MSSPAGTQQQSVADALARRVEVRRGQVRIPGADTD